MSQIKLCICVLSLIFGLAGQVFAVTITVDATNSLTVDGTAYNLVSDTAEGGGLMWEENTDGSYKVCLCKMVAYGALQTVASYLGITDLDSSTISIKTGWNTDGAEELYVDSMPWTEDDLTYSDPITAGKDLTLADAWFEFTIEGYGTYRVTSSEENYTFENDETATGYMEGWDFFDYRSYVKSGGTGDTKAYFANSVRAAVVENLKGENTFEIQAVPVPGTAFLMISGLMGLAVLKRKKY